MGISNWGLAWTLIMPIALILYYFYRKKYKDQPVSSILYWQQVMKEMQASPYLKKLQQHALFYIQLAALLLLVLALMNPFFKSQSLEGGEFIFVIDTSASMLAGSPSALEQHKEVMKDLAVRTQGKPVTIINAGSNPEVLVSKVQSEPDLIRAIEGIAPGYESSQMEKTILFAETLLEENSGAIHIFTDSLDRSVLTPKTGLAYEVHAVREKPANVSMRQFGVAEEATASRAIVQILNDSEEAVSAEIELTGGNHTVTEAITLEAGEERLIPFENLPASDLWQASIAADDDYIWDNQMFTYNSRGVDSVIIDNSLHNLVARGVESLGITVNSTAAEELTEFTGVPIVTNQSGMIGGDSPVLLIGRDDESSEAVSGEVESAVHPLFSYAPMENVFISQIYPGFEGFTTVATVGDEPFIQVSPQGDIVVLADIEATDWPLSPSFPLFLWSAFNELGGTDEYLGTFLPKEHRAVSLSSGSGEWEIFKGDEFQFSYIEGESSFQAPKEPGVYRAVNDAESKTFVVQLNNEEKTFAAGQDFSIGSAAESETSTEQSILLWILLLILLLMLVEWEVYRRGTSYR